MHPPSVHREPWSRRDGLSLSRIDLRSRWQSAQRAGGSAVGAIPHHSWPRWGTDHRHWWWPMSARAAVFLLLVTTLPDVLIAQEDTTKAKPPRPFVEGGAYDKPYLGRLFGRTAIGGYAEAHVRYERANGALD